MEETVCSYTKKVKHHLDRIKLNQNLNNTSSDGGGDGVPDINDSATSLNQLTFDKVIQTVNNQGCNDVASDLNSNLIIKTAPLSGVTSPSNY